MAWNAPQSGKMPQRVKSNRGVRPLFLAGAALVVVAVVCIVAWLIVGGEKPPEKAEPPKVKKTSPIKTVAPDLTPAKPVVKDEPPAMRGCPETPDAGHSQIESSLS